MATFTNSDGQVLSDVDVSRILNSGTPIAIINGIQIFAPPGASVTRLLSSGIPIASINDVILYAPQGGGGGGSASAYMDSVCGEAGIRASKASMSDGEYIALEDYPYANTCGECYQFRAKIASFSRLKIGRGTNNASNGAFAGTYHCWLEIDDTNIYIYRNSTQLIGTIAHGLTISGFITVNMRYTDEKKMYVTIMTLGGVATKIINQYSDASTPFWVTDAMGMVKAVSDGSTLTDCKLSATNYHFKSPLWIFGASYEEHSGWQSQVRNMGFSNFLINAYPGRDSATCYADFVRATAFGFPKFLYWTMYGNGSSSDLDTYIGQVKALCDAQGATLVIIQRPNSTATDVQQNYTAKQAVIDSYIAQGVRYVDAASALSSNPSSPDGWYTGFLASDGKHPTQLGHKALAMQVLQDLPEIMEY